MDISQIRKLIRLIQNSGVTEIEVTEGDQTVRISCREHVVAPQVQFAAPAPLVATPTTATPEAPLPAAEDHSEHLVKSPMVGTFYRAPSPEASPFVSENTKVRKGDILCIIEAMKLMNEIEAKYDGVVEEILVGNASPLEYGQPMFVITPLA
ncbi:MAG: acetyl-CoA carboxylase biotin carboxyl carrier protein [Mariprofundaceae bacterium]|nr:acetyl-CoA carboxylase biotin carboxyl carrier protein [Mariprofundaceae bacterium]